MKHFIAIVFLGLLSLNAQTNTKSAEISSQKHTNEIKLLESIRQNYALFIDTKPSQKKNELAQKVKMDIETFEAIYPHSTVMPQTLALLREVDIYLDEQP